MKKKTNTKLVALTQSDRFFQWRQTSKQRADSPVIITLGVRLESFLPHEVSDPKCILMHVLFLH